MLIVALDRCGVRIDDFTDNGILLPASAAAAKGVGLAIHAGAHPNYNRAIIRQLEHIADKTLLAPQPDWPALLRAIRTLQNAALRLFSSTAIPGATVDQVFSVRTTRATDILLDQQVDAAFDAARALQSR